MKNFVDITTNIETNRKRDLDIASLQKRINSPKVDLLQVNDTYKIRIELPGVNKNSIKIQIKDNKIILISYTKTPFSYENENVIYREARYTEMTRRIKLPSPVIYEQINTNDLVLENGVLYLEFVKNDVNVGIATNADWADV